MSTDGKTTTFKTYWIAWAVLLALTLAMIAVGAAKLPHNAMVALLLLGMAGKALVIGAYFMHLRYERITLVLIVALSLALTGTALFLGIALDGIRAFELAPK
jgi:cytochrome c oxidase subunit IV